jgi:hypothetical protein
VPNDMRHNCVTGIGCTVTGFLVFVIVSLEIYGCEIQIWYRTPAAMVPAIKYTLFTTLLFLLACLSS